MPRVIRPVDPDEIKIQDAERMAQQLLEVSGRGVLCALLYSNVVIVVLVFCENWHLICLIISLSVN